MSRRRLLLGARIGFVLLTIGFAWWGFHGRWDEIGEQIARSGPIALSVAVVLTGAGLSATALLWRRVLSRLGTTVPRRDASAVFLVGQLGKYIPGSVWTFAAQASLGRRHRVPARASVTASSVFLLLHTFSGLLLGSVLALTGALDTRIDRWWWLAAAVGSLVVVSPPVVRRIADRMVGKGTTARFSASDLLVTLVVMAGVWFTYGAAVGALLDVRRGDQLVLATGAFAISHAVGVLLILAPAGLGAREGVLIALLSPTFGVGAAAATALLARVVHAVADFAAAAMSRALASSRRPAPTSQPTPEDVHAAVS